MSRQREAERLTATTNRRFAAAETGRRQWIAQPVRRNRVLATQPIASIEVVGTQFVAVAEIDQCAGAVMLAEHRWCQDVEQRLISGYRLAVDTVAGAQHQVLGDFQRRAELVGRDIAPAEARAAIGTELHTIDQRWIPS